MTSFIAAYSLVLINVVFTAYSLVLAEVILYSLYGLVLVKKDSPSVGVLDSYQVLGSTVPVFRLGYPQANWHGVLLIKSCSTGVSARSLISLGSSIIPAVGLGYL